MRQWIIPTVWIMAIASATACERAPSPEPATVSTTSTRGPVTVTVSLASEQIDIGTPQTILIEVLAEPGVDIQIPSFEAESIEGFHINSTSIRSNLPAEALRLWEVELVIDTFNAAVETFPPITIPFTDRRAEIPIDGSISTEAIQISLHSQIDPDDTATQTLRDIRGHQSPAVPGSLWYWLFPVAAVVIFAVLLWRSQGTDASRADIPQRLPHIAAADRLDALDRSGLIERREFHPYFVELSDILRQYVEARFSLHAPDRTTEEFLSDMRQTPLLNDDQKATMGRFLRAADMVKFAKHNPEVTDAQEAMVVARRFVDETAPALDEAQERVT
jgi:hypothetical protein